MSDSTPQDRARRLVPGFRAWVEELAATGVDGFPRTPVGRAEAVAVAFDAPAPTPRPVDSRPDREPEERARIAPATADAAAKPDELPRIREDIGDCRRCKLCHGRTNVVFGVGDPNAIVMFVGEGPGEDEDRKGEPFVGRAGQLLTDIIRNGMGIRREDVYIANVVKCRPPNNRNPEPDEIAACQPFLLRQIETIRPRVIVALGKFAAQTLLQTTTPIGRLRGRWHEFRGAKLMPTFHPSYLLRNPADKRLVWQDIQQVMAEVGLPVPPPKTRP